MAANAGGPDTLFKMGWAAKEESPQCLCQPGSALLLGQLHPAVYSEAQESPVEAMEAQRGCVSAWWHGEKSDLSPSKMTPKSLALAQSGVWGL